MGGAPLSRRVYENLSALGVQTLTAYGLTGTTALYSIATLGDDPHVGSAGRACDLPGVETAVSVDGMLLIRGPNVFKGYYRDAEATAKVLSEDGWFRTGDYGCIDADGFVWVTGRASRTIVFSSGKKSLRKSWRKRYLRFREYARLSYPAMAIRARSRPRFMRLFRKNLPGGRSAC